MGIPVCKWAGIAKIFAPLRIIRGGRQKNLHVGRRITHNEVVRIRGLTCSFSVVGLKFLAFIMEIHSQYLLRVITALGPVYSGLEIGVLEFRGSISTKIMGYEP